jgi:undecaprenyl pyrophosphate synthase
MDFDEIMDEAWMKHSGVYTVGPENLDRVADLMASDIMNDFSNDFRQLIKIEILKRYNSFYDVMKERGNSVRHD